VKIGIKSKLVIGISFLFTVIALLCVVSFYSIERLSDQSKNILKANYESVQFSKSMLQALDLIEMSDSSGWKKFEENLRLQETNITEIGENEVTQDIRDQFGAMKEVEQVKKMSVEIRQDIYKILELNMNAIFRKNGEALQTSNTLNLPDGDRYILFS